MKYEADTLNSDAEALDTASPQISREPILVGKDDSDEPDQVSCSNGESESDPSRDDDHDDDDDFDPFDLDTISDSPLDASIAKELESKADELTDIALDKFISATIPTRSKKRRSGHLDLSESDNKRLKVACFEKYMLIDQSSDANDQDTIIVDLPRPATYEHLACPFYIYDKESYSSCLRRADMRSILDVKQHLCTVHRQPPYCPVCHATFASSIECDQHIRAAVCESSALSRPVGITFLQVQQLARRAEPWVSVTLQWLSIWEIVFPGAALPLLLESSSSTRAKAAVYLTGEVEAIVCVLREFWASEGARIVTDFQAEKRQKGVSQPARDHRISILGSMVLDRVIDRLVANCTQRDNGGSRLRDLRIRCWGLHGV
ncbi:hypothetical protein F5Y18DRAFT_369291 [Xylariaceae sp. FL1019]|nr:hypothetical protein F5Y18DRAFT_369291 [Xylariaceae sp. FL1019]